MKKVKLGDVCKVQGGYAFKSKEFQKDSIPIIRIGNIQDNKVEIDYNVCFTKEFLNKHPEFEIKYGDILIAMSGATVGKIGKYQNDTKALLNQRVGNFIVTEKLEKRYLYFLLQSPLFEKFILNNAFGCAQPNISSKQIEEFEFYNYDNVRQLEIADKLNKVQEVIDIRKKQIEELDELIKSQFVEMFESKDFDKKTLQDITIKITDGSHNPPSGIAENLGYMMLSSQNIINDKINYENARYLSKEDFERENTRTDLRNGDVLLTIVGTVGRTAIIKNEENITLQRSVAVLKPIKEIKSEYLVGALKSDDVVRQLNKGAKGVAQKGIYLNDLKKLVISVPPIDLQNKFADFVKQIDKQKFEIQRSLEETQKLQESLMNKYFG